MLRLLIPFSIAFTLIAALFLSLTPSRILAMQPPPPEPVYRLNSEGDEWILVTPDQVEPSPSARQLFSRMSARISRQKYLLLRSPDRKLSWGSPWTAPEGSVLRRS